MVDSHLIFGWWNSPGIWCLFSAALEHAHVWTTFRYVVVTAFGLADTSHVIVSASATVGHAPRVSSAAGRLTRGSQAFRFSHQRRPRTLDVATMSFFRQPMPASICDAGPVLG